ncbi:hypothetical protein O3G_MSEX008577 [Manduca sexta]|uniref:Uncharacterized protein n=1 Tax=Manduca sexta TaxID=7130 RepID=A0A921ZB26_MANSE|nr:hypothetical protein O3G_MSEX008577 [Manduca sexta]
MIRSLFFLICVSRLSASTITTPKCKLNDNACVNELANTIFQKAIAGDAELGMEKLSPLHQEKIEGDLSVIKYTLQNTSCYGFEKCKVKNLEYTPGSLKILALLQCPELVLKGHYEIDGQLIVLPIQGKGLYELTSSNYDIALDCDTKKTTGNDGKTYATIRQYSIAPVLRGSMDFMLENLFNGREDLAAPVRKFMKENYKEVAELLQGPVFSANIKKIVKNLNKVLKTSPIEDVIDS